VSIETTKSFLQKLGLFEEKREEKRDEDLDLFLSWSSILETWESFLLSTFGTFSVFT
jgi:hypothetical protein